MQLYHINLQAANPGCVIGDFVRWYSPRDWITEEKENDDGTVVNVGQYITIQNKVVLVKKMRHSHPY